MAVLAADLAGSGVTSNVLVPGGMTDTPLVGDAPNRKKMLRPAIMVPPLLWLLTDEARSINGKRFIAADLGCVSAAGAGGREGWRADRLAQHRPHADRANVTQQSRGH
jgi:NAD(P)-dependent dehydrogenase (short-subunit alcohol dehydrogenase family)